ncbi:hypothetical protein IFM89_034340 [Coptis chinensis]|uniref:SWIM-type domain-containing protein n=1 Tax=Coptis chinensis TaxID=261450 RepID=A0A835HAD3_9MAGN|nr:hypothetical protein IFM89_034340 [Coptis chinensis]
MTYKLPELTRILGTINKTDSVALDWLDNEPRECWARAHFDWTSKCDELTNNFSESFNSWILKIRDKPLVQFIDMYNLLLLKSIYDRRMLSMNFFEHGVVPNVLYMIKKREERYNNYEIRGVTETQYLAISHLTGKQYNVEIQKQECSCIEWQMSGVPCVHAVAVLRSRREPWSRYCSPYFSAEAFKATSTSYLYPLDNIEDWSEIEDQGSRELGQMMKCPSQKRNVQSVKKKVTILDHVMQGKKGNLARRRKEKQPKCKMDLRCKMNLICKMDLICNNKLLQCKKMHLQCSKEKGRKVKYNHNKRHRHKVGEGEAGEGKEEEPQCKRQLQCKNHKQNNPQAGEVEEEEPQGREVAPVTRTTSSKARGGRGKAKRRRERRRRGMEGEGVENSLACMACCLVMTM